MIKSPYLNQKVKLVKTWHNKLIFCVWNQKKAKKNSHASVSARWKCLFWSAVWHWNCTVSTGTNQRLTFEVFWAARINQNKSTTIYTTKLSNNIKTTTTTRRIDRFILIIGLNDGYNELHLFLILIKHVECICKYHIEYYTLPYVYWYSPILRHTPSTYSSTNLLQFNFSIWILPQKDHFTCLHQFGQIKSHVKFGAFHFSSIFRLQDLCCRGEFRH